MNSYSNLKLLYNYQIHKQIIIIDNLEFLNYFKILYVHYISHFQGIYHNFIKIPPLLF